MKKSVRTVSCGNLSLTYTLERKAVKNINLRVRRGEVYVSAPSGVSLSETDNMVRKYADRILEIQKKQMSSPSVKAPEYSQGEIFYLTGRPLQIELAKSPWSSVLYDDKKLYISLPDPENPDARRKLMDGFIAITCDRLFAKKALEIHNLFKDSDEDMPVIKVKYMRSQWGSCIPAKRTVTLNKQLIHAPLPCIEHVILHEFCHFVYPNHSKDFYGLMARFQPDWKARKDLLLQSAKLWFVR